MLHAARVGAGGSIAVGALVHADDVVLPHGEAAAGPGGAGSLT